MLSKGTCWAFNLLNSVTSLRTVTATPGTPLFMASNQGRKYGGNSILRFLLPLGSLAALKAPWSFSWSLLLLCGPLYYSTLSTGSSMLRLIHFRQLKLLIVHNGSAKRKLISNQEGRDNIPILHTLRGRRAHCNIVSCRKMKWKETKSTGWGLSRLLLRGFPLVFWGLSTIALSHCLVPEEKEGGPTRVDVWGAGYKFFALDFCWSKPKIKNYNYKI